MVLSDISVRIAVERAAKVRAWLSDHIAGMLASTESGPGATR